MRVTHVRSMRGNEVDIAGAKGVVTRIPISADDGAPSFTMRLFTIFPGGNTPYHSHDYEHEIFVINGRGALLSAEGRKAVAPGDAILILPGELHGFEADGSLGMEMLCMVPNRAYVPGQFTVTPGTWEAK